MVLKMLGEFVDKKFTKSINTEYLGPQIKKRRKEMDLTQEEIAKGICCISYLSKVENRQMAGNHDIIMEMMKKLEIDTNIIENVEKYNDYILKAIKYFALKEEDKLKELFDFVIKDGDIYYADLIRLAYYVFKKDIESSKILISNLLLIKDSLEDNELIFYLILLAKNYFNSEEYHNAEYIYNLIDRFNIIDVYAKIIVAEGVFYTKIKTGRFISIGDAYNEYIKDCDTINNYCFSSIAKVKYSLLLLYEGDKIKGEKIFDNIIDKVSEPLRERCLAIKAGINGKYEEAIKLIFESEDKYKNIILLYCYDKIGDLDNIQKILQKIKTDNLDFEYNLLVQGIKNKYHSKGAFYYKKFLRETAFPYTYKNYDYLWANYFGEELIEVLRNDSCYKEATMICIKLLKMK